MPIMQFDSRRGWFNPNPNFDRASRCDAPLRSGASIGTNRPTRPLPVEKEDFFVLLDRARAGDSAAERELRARGNDYSPRR